MVTEMRLARHAKTFANSGESGQIRPKPTTPADAAGGQKNRNSKGGGGSRCEIPRVGSPRNRVNFKLRSVRRVRRAIA
jgi:hypothetical protein